jgi:phage shock protein PspC (stress-responsive transcriptional regulator)
MARSFSDRVFGGVCGGFAVTLRLNAWFWRVAFVVLTLISGGAFLAAYLILWWVMPMESPAVRRRGGITPIIPIAILIAAFALWLANLRGVLVSPTGENLYIPILFVAVALVYFLRQVRLAVSGGSA